MTPAEFRRMLLAIAWSQRHEYVAIAAGYYVLFTADTSEQAVLGCCMLVVAALLHYVWVPPQEWLDAVRKFSGGAK